MAEPIWYPVPFNGRLRVIGKTSSVVRWRPTKLTMTNLRACVAMQKMWDEMRVEESLLENSYALLMGDDIPLKW